MHCWNDCAKNKTTRSTALSQSMRHSGATFRCFDCLVYSANNGNRQWNFSYFETGRSRARSLSAMGLRFLLHSSVSSMLVKRYSDERYLPGRRVSSSILETLHIGRPLPQHRCTLLAPELNWHCSGGRAAKMAGGDWSSCLQRDYLGNKTHSCNHLRVRVLLGFKGSFRENYLVKSNDLEDSRLLSRHSLCRRRRTGGIRQLRAPASSQTFAVRPTSYTAGGWRQWS